MQLNTNDLILHPDIHWIKVDDTRLQIRQPNGDNITFDKYASEINQILNFLKDPSLDISRLDANLMEELIELLFAKGFLSSKHTNDNQFNRIAKLSLNNEQKYEGSLPRSVAIVGKGILAAIVRTSLQNAKVKINESGNPNALKIVVADQDDYHFLSDENKKAIEADQSTLFFRWINGKFRIGPYVVPKDTACLECAYQRELASNLFVDEMRSYMNCSSNNLPTYEGGAVLDNLASALITRQILLILQGYYRLSGVSTIITVDPLLFQTTHSPILKLPRCKICSCNTKRAVRNYRDLIKDSEVVNS
ncbi:TOMM precursor leader peptide-binding protein [Aquimarina agarivorans]|uniref:TOMM precursor leader peptide-binding protein n=1 Tax=Aquimarina agarivorans TaxID=980584 RepID=UPI000248F305|nr:TOMM precursor leader peptide-binding protein [Aquimarina agarivorans]